MTDSTILTLIGACGAAIFLLNKIIKWMNERNDDSSQDLFDTIEQMKEEKEEKIDEIGNETRAIMKEALGAMGCPMEEEADGTIRTAYQGENFHIMFAGRYARIMDPAWTQVDTNDPNFTNIRDAVNWTNYDMGARVVMSFPNSDGIVQIHSYEHLPLFPNNPENNVLIRRTLDGFFYAHDAVGDRLREIVARKDDQKKNRRPVGFATGQNENIEKE